MSKKSTADDRVREMITKIAHLANANRESLDGTTAPVKRIIAENELVFGIWTDPKEPLGVDTLIIKGERRLAAIAESGKPSPPGATKFAPPNGMKMSAVPCSSYEQAFVLRQAFGDGSGEVPK